MKLNKYLSGAVVLSLVSSCTYYTPLDEVNEPSRLVLYCYPGNGENTVVRLSRSLPVGSKNAPAFSPEKAEVHFFLNGEEQPLQWTDDSLPGIPAQSFYRPGRLNERDLVRITAAADGMKAVTSSTAVPKPFLADSIRMERKPSDPGKLQFRIHFTDRKDTDNYYAVRVENKQIHNLNGNYNEWIYDLHFDLEKEPLLNTNTGLDDILMREENYYQNLYFWDDTRISGKSYTLRLTTNYMPDSEDTYDSPEGEVHAVYKYQYRISLYSLSEEFYKYLKSMNDQHNNELGKTELAPIRATYTNVTNGIGLVGGCRFTQTQWLDNLPAE